MATVSYFVFAFLLCGLIIPVHNDEKPVEAATVNPHVPSTISLTSTNDTASLTVNPTETGTFAKTSGASDIQFSVSTNNYSGYTLTTRTSKTSLDRGSDQILSLASSVTEEQFAASGNTTLNNRWGFKPNYYNSTINSKYQVSPTSTSVTLDKTTAASTTGKDYTISLGVRVNYSIGSGTYVNNTLVLESVANPIVYTIDFSGADDDIVNNMPSSIHGESASTTEVTVPSTVPTRRNYTFVKWCDVRPTETHGGQTCSGNSVNPGDKYGLNYTQSNVITLYAVWTSNRGCNRAATTIGTGNSSTDAVCMQDINDTVISSMTEDVQHTLIDERDGKTYFISKLIDGKVWMTQNLNYHLDTDVTLTHHNTDLGYTSENLSKTWTPSYSTILDGTTSYNNGEDKAGSWFVTRYYYTSGSTSNDTSSTTCNNASTCEHYSLGTSYNYAAAIAENFATTTLYDKNPDSVCPAGWRLPNGYSTDAYAEFNTLGMLYGYLNRYVPSGNTTYLTGGFNSIRVAPMYLNRTGYRIANTNYSTGVAGYYWTRSIAADDKSYGFSFTSTNFYPLQTLVRTTAFPIRCVSRMNAPGTTTVTFDGNGAQSGDKSYIIVDSGTAVNLSTANYYKANYFQTEWNTSADGTGTSYGLDEVIFTKAGNDLSIKLFAQWEPAYTIVYNGNNPTSTTTMPVNHVAVDGDAITLYAPNYLRTGYGFLGWSTTQIDPNSANFATQLANAKVWGPNETITANYETFGQNVPTAITLYAVWVKSSGNLQDWNNCRSLTAAQFSDGVITPGSVIALTDTRDNNTYAVAKLADGNCWMIENLRLNDTGFSDPSKSAPFAGVFDGLATSEDSYFTSSTSANSKYNSSMLQGSNFSSRFPRYNNNNTNAGGTNSSGTTLVASPSTNDNHSQWYGYGNYYTWAAANANTDDVTNYNEIQTSICPSGWYLPMGNPTSTSGSTFLRLAVAYGGSSSVVSYGTSTSPTGAVMSNRFRSYPNNLVLSGYYSSSSATARGTNGSLWSSASSSATYGRIIQSQLNTFYITTTYKYYGLPVRCIVGSDYKVVYNGNGADAGQSMSVTHSAIPDSTIELYASNYKRTGYGFLGWSFTQIDPDASNAATQIANATIYGPNETITLPSSISGDLVLYAVWMKSAGNLQGWTGCSSMSSGSVTALKDTRDNQVYAVAKLADGNCWMMENLRLDAANSSDSTKAQGFGGVFVGLPNPEFIFGSSTISNQLYTVSSSETELNLIIGDNLYYRFPRYANPNIAHTVSNMGSSGSNVYSYGNYYNYASAMASTSDFTAQTVSESAGSSICPAGWMLPTADPTSNATSSKLFNYLYRVVNGATTSDISALRSYPYNIIRSGYGTGSNIANRGTGGYYVAKSSLSTSGVYSLYFNTTTSTSVSMTGSTKYMGFSVRCIAASGIEIILDANDGSGRTERIYGISGSSVTLPRTVSFARPNKNLNSWNTAANGSGTTYSNSITVSSSIRLYAQWIDTYTITYDGNNSTSSATAMASFNHQNIAPNSSIMLYSPYYLRTGYGFVGWSTTQINPDASNAATLIANAKIFGPNQDVVANATNLGASAPANVTLYAVWVKSSGNLQNWTGCSSLTAATYSNGTITPGSVIALTDTRDNQTYAVTKYPDGRCWMIEPLRLSPIADSIGPENTNNPTEAFVANNTSIASSCTAVSAACFDRINGSVPTGKIDRYYNWYTATAGNGTYSSPTSGNIGDLCPKGWKLPTYSTTSEFAYLTQSLGGSTSNSTTATNPTAAVMSARLRTYPINLKYTGYATSQTATAATITAERTTGYYTLAGAYGTNNRYGYVFSLNSTNVYNNNGQNRYYGVTQACVKKPSEVIYDGNGADSGMSMGVSHAATPNSTITLYASNYKRTGYGFLGWSFTQIDPDASNAATQIANATIYGPNETITLPSSISGDLVLYAVWMKSAGNLQGWTGCSSMSSGSVTALKDTRDNQVYAVAKLADGNCWMMENLRLDAANSSDSTKAQGFGGVFVGLATSESINFSPSTIANSLYSVSFNQRSGTSIAGNYLETRIPRYNNSNTANTVSFMTSGNQNIYSYGNYYNFRAATADTHDYFANNIYGTSICPAGWGLPTAGSGSTFYNLNASVNSGSTSTSAGLRRYPNNFIYSGFISGSAFSNRGSFGAYNSRSLVLGSSTLDRYDLYFNSIYVATTMSRPQTHGLPVRCVSASGGYTLTLDANDGSDRVQRFHTVLTGNAVTLSSSEFITDGYVIGSWNTKADGSGTSYAPRTSYTIASNTTLYAQWIQTYSIVYNGNGSTSGSTPTLTMLGPSESAYLTTSYFTKTGYGFLGWSLNANGSGTIYGANESVDVSSIIPYANASNEITMYAIWIQSTGNLQGWTGCGSLSIPTAGTPTTGFSNVTALTDNRDNKVYVVARLADGHCWLGNDLALGDSDISTDLTSANTNLSTTIPASTFNSWRTTAPTSSYTDAYVLPIASLYGKPGVMYNFCASSAGTHCSQDDYRSPVYDLCPSGWTEPGATGYRTQDLVSAGYSSSDLLRKGVTNGGAGLTMSTNTSSSFSTTYYTDTLISDTGNMYPFMINATSTIANYGYTTDSSFVGAMRCIAKNNSTIIRVSYDDFTSTGGQIKIGDSWVTNRRTIIVDKNTTYSLNATVRDNFSFVSYSASAGTLADPTYRFTTLNTGNADLIELSVNSEYVGEYIQNLPSSSCTTTEKTVLDKRDMQPYTIKRLADGNCWMTANLNLGSVTYPLIEDLTVENTNAFNTITKETFSSWRKASPASVQNSGVYVVVYGKDSVSGSPYGSLYNYYAASAGTISSPTAAVGAENDICPAGWRLPTSNTTDGETKVLYDYYNSLSLMRSPTSSSGAGFALAGSFTSSLVSPGTKGSYWSSTPYGLVNNVDYINYLSLDSTNSTVSPVVGSYYANGYSIRCIMGKTISDLTYLQELNTLKDEDKLTVIKSMHENTAYTLRDNRDNQQYQIGRLKDNRLWMIDNLNLGATTLSTNLTSANSNVKNTVSYSTFNGYKVTTPTGTDNVPQFIPVSGTDSTSNTKYGTLYSFLAAIAGQPMAISRDFDSYYDICPAGWRMPTDYPSYSSQSDIYRFYTNYTGIFNNSITAGGGALAPAGTFYSSITAPGAYSRFWSSTSYGTGSNYAFNSTTLNGTAAFSGGYAFGAGMSVRCIAKNTTTDVTISYGLGVSDVWINGVKYYSGEVAKIEKNSRARIEVRPSNNYSFSGWSITGGGSTIVNSANPATTLIVTGDKNTLSVAVTATTNVTSIQNLSPSNCTSTATTVKDSRDGQLYTIQRLDDGECWMLDNLNLGLNTISSDLTSSNTNISSSISASTFNGWRKELNNITTGTTPATSGQLYSIIGKDSTSNTGYGALYNYYAATAGTISGESLAVAEYDLCPAGWRLPTGGSSGDFATLYKNASYNSFAKMTSSTGARFARAGWINATYGSIDYLNDRTDYWTSSPNMAVLRNVLLLMNNSVYVGFDQTQQYRPEYMYSIRCVLKENVSINSITTLQDFYTIPSYMKNSVISSMAQNTLYSLTDIRDNQSYRIAKLLDGNVYMVDNLNLGDSNYPRNTKIASITASNTNVVASGWSAPYGMDNFYNARKTANFSSYTELGFVNLAGTDATSGTKFGSIYNYCALTFGEICSSSNSASATRDICPAGWRIPTGGASGEWLALYNAYGSHANMRKAVTSGGAGIAYYGTATPFLGPNMSQSNNFYWSPNRYDNLAQNALMIYGGTSTSANDFRDRYYGGFVRCRLK